MKEKTSKSRILQTSMGCQKLTYGTTENTNLKVVYRARNIAQGFLRIDPLKTKYPFYTPYQYAGNKPIRFVDIDGLEEGFNIRFEQMHKGYLKGTVTEQELKDFNNANAFGLAMGIGVLLTRGAILRYGPQLAWWAMNPANQHMMVGIGGLTASLIDPNPASNYPGSFDDVARGAKLLIKNSNAERFIINSSKFDYFFGKVKAGVDATQKQINNAFKSAERSDIFKKLGFDEASKGKEKLVELFDNALENGTEIGKYSDDYGTTITKQIKVKNGETTGTVNVNFLYRNGETTPEVTTAVPKIVE